MSVDLLLWIGAAVCFFLAAIGVSAGRVNLVALGLFFGALTFIV
jgi:hypothetical protein